MKTGVQKINITRLRSGKVQSCTDVVAQEIPLSIKIKLFGESKVMPVSLTMRTPGNDIELSLGFLFTEGILHSMTDVLKTEIPAENEVVVHTAENFYLDVKKVDRNFYTTSSCGVCGKSSIDSLQINASYAIQQVEIPDATILFSLKKNIQCEQSLFSLTGGIHAAALFDLEGTLLHLFEDVGRHNALDKLIGYSFINNNVPLNHTLLFLSGRTSFELVQKATMAGIPLLVSVGAPSSLAVELAQENNQRLVGFLKEDGYNVYA